MNEAIIYGKSRISEDDIYLFKEGRHFRLYEILGAHELTIDGKVGVSFALWAPNAISVSVIGDFNGWDSTNHPLKVRWDGSGIWEGFIPAIVKGETYKYHIVSDTGEPGVDKADPFAFFSERAPNSASRIWKPDYEWNDKEWMDKRAGKNSLSSPVSIYEVHIGSWRRKDHNERLTYREMSDSLVEYVSEMGFTHVELMPVMEHPFYGSWGYQITGYFAPTSRYGTPEDLMYLVDSFHKKDIAVILDWVPSHFPTDEHGLGLFDGTNLFEHEDKRRGYHPEWKSLIFNYGRFEIRAFLISNALFWLDKYHIDGLRVDAVASMLYLDYAREEDEWEPNKFGGKENLEAIEFLRAFNTAVYEHYPDVQTMAEESTSWPMVSRPVDIGGLGFGKKWNMGWMHDTLKYFSKDPIHRRHHHHDLTFSIVYAFSENFLLPLSHDEVVYGKGSLIGKMPGDDWRRYANLRSLFGYMYAHPGKKLLFMGSELAQEREWNHDRSLDWHILDKPANAGVKRWVSDLNHFYKDNPALFEVDFNDDGFEWVDCDDFDGSTLSFIRKSADGTQIVLFVGNLTPVPREGFIIGVPGGGEWIEGLNSDATIYGGSGLGNLGKVKATKSPSHGRPYSLKLTLPPLSTLFFVKE